MFRIVLLSSRLLRTLSKSFRVCHMGCSVVAADVFISGIGPRFSGQLVLGTAHRLPGACRVDLSTI